MADGGSGYFFSGDYENVITKGRIKSKMFEEDVIGKLAHGTKSSMTVDEAYWGYWYSIITTIDAAQRIAEHTRGGRDYKLITSALGGIGSVYGKMVNGKIRIDSGDFIVDPRNISQYSVGMSMFPLCYVESVEVLLGVAISSFFPIAEHKYVPVKMENSTILLSIPGYDIEDQNIVRYTEILLSAFRSIPIDVVDTSFKEPRIYTRHITIRSPTPIQGNSFMFAVGAAARFCPYFVYTGALGENWNIEAIGQLNNKITCVKRNNMFMIVPDQPGAEEYTYVRDVGNECVNLRKVQKKHSNAYRMKVLDDNGKEMLWRIWLNRICIKDFKQEKGEEPLKKRSLGPKESIWTWQKEGGENIDNALRSMVEWRVMVMQTLAVSVDPRTRNVSKYIADLIRKMDTFLSNISNQRLRAVMEGDIRSHSLIVTDLIARIIGDRGESVAVERYAAISNALGYVHRASDESDMGTSDVSGDSAESILDQLANEIVASINDCLDRECIVDIERRYRERLNVIYGGDAWPMDVKEWFENGMRANYKMFELRRAYKAALENMALDEDSVRCSILDEQCRRFVDISSMYKREMPRRVTVRAQRPVRASGPVGVPSSAQVPLPVLGPYGYITNPEILAEFETWGKTYANWISRKYQLNHIPDWKNFELPAIFEDMFPAVAYGLMTIFKNAGDVSTVTRVFRELSLRVHPDKASGKSEAIQEIYKRGFVILNVVHLAFRDSDKVTFARFVEGMRDLCVLRNDAKREELLEHMRRPIVDFEKQAGIDVERLEKDQKEAWDKMIKSFVEMAGSIRRQKMVEYEHKLIIQLNAAEFRFSDMLRKLEREREMKLIDIVSFVFKGHIVKNMNMVVEGLRLVKAEEMRGTLLRIRVLTDKIYCLMDVEREQRMGMVRGYGAVLKEMLVRWKRPLIEIGNSEGRERILRVEAAAAFEMFQNARLHINFYVEQERGRSGILGEWHEVMERVRFGTYELSGRSALVTSFSDAMRKISDMEIRGRREASTMEEERKRIDMESVRRSMEMAMALDKDAIKTLTSKVQNAERKTEELVGELESKEREHEAKMNELSSVLKSVMGKDIINVALMFEEEHRRWSALLFQFSVEFQENMIRIKWYDRMMRCNYQDAELLRGELEVSKKEVEELKRQLNRQESLADYWAFYAESANRISGSLDDVLEYSMHTTGESFRDIEVLDEVKTEVGETIVCPLAPNPEACDILPGGFIPQPGSMPGADTDGYELPDNMTGVSMETIRRMQEFDRGLEEKKIYLASRAGVRCPPGKRKGPVAYMNVNGKKRLFSTCV